MLTELPYNSFKSYCANIVQIQTYTYFLSINILGHLHFIGHYGKSVHVAYDKLGHKPTYLLNYIQLITANHVKSFRK